MTQPSNRSIPADSANSDSQPAELKRPQWQLELLWLAGGIGVGLAVLPLMIFAVGQKLLGDYGGGSLVSFYGNYIASLIGGSLAAWSLILGPAFVSAAIRHSLRLYQPTKAIVENPAETVAVAHKSEPIQRREPFVGN